MESRGNDDGSKAVRALSDSPVGHAAPTLPLPAPAFPGPVPIATPTPASGSTPAPHSGPASDGGYVASPIRDRPTSAFSPGGTSPRPDMLALPFNQPERGVLPGTRDHTFSFHSHGDRPSSGIALDPDARGMPAMPHPFSYSHGPPGDGSVPNHPAAQRADSYVSEARFVPSNHGHRDMVAGAPPEMVQRGMSMRRSMGPGPGDWNGPTRMGTLSSRMTGKHDNVEYRLLPTLELSKKRQLACAAKAKLMGRSLNAAIGLQIVIGALITGLAAVTTGRNTSIMTSILGAFSTIIGSFLARMRGSAEPDLSKSRAKGFDKFVRTLEAYIVDFGDEPAKNHQSRISELRHEYEELEGSLNAEQKGNNV